MAVREFCCETCAWSFINRNMCLLRSAPLRCGQNIASKRRSVCITSPNRPSSGSWSLKIPEFQQSMIKSMKQTAICLSQAGHGGICVDHSEIKRRYVTFLKWSTSLQ